MPLGGISPERILRRMISHPSRLVVSEDAWVNCAMLTPPDAKFSL